MTHDTTPPKRIWVRWPQPTGTGLAFTCQSRPPELRTEYILASDAEAMVAAELREAADRVYDYGDAKIILALIPQPAAAALDKLIAEAEARGMELAANIAEKTPTGLATNGEFFSERVAKAIRAEKAEADRDRLAAELAAAQQREARRTFPILKGDGAKIDYQLVADHSEQARRNHGQSVDRLAARGGLSWCELYAVLHNRKWEKVDTNEAMIACRSIEARYLAARAALATLEAGK